MDETAKYLIHAEITAAGIVERSDVVGAVFGQTEGLLGDEMDLRDLQDSKKVGRIDVEIQSEGGQSYGQITVGSGLDKVETAILAAAFETIEQVGPCRAEITVTDIEDVRSAKRREIVERATELLAAFDAHSIRTEDIVETVRQRTRVEDITEYEGFPAGPRVTDSDAIVVVEGRADVLQLLKYGVKNAVAVEGTDVPDAIADLTAGRTVTAFLDGDRGGDLILKELAQVGAVDYVAVAPRGSSVEELSRGEAMKALREKIPYDVVADADSPEAALDAVETRADGSSATDDGGAQAASDAGGQSAAVATVESETAETGDVETIEGETTDTEPEPASETTEPTTLADHIDEIIGANTGSVRLLDDDLSVLSEGDADGTVSLIESCNGSLRTVVLDGTCTQKVLDVAAQCGAGVVVAADEGEYVKQPASVQVRVA